ncbi:MAG: ABC transporter ATP-binding protein [Cellulosilyticaceae bacterium]
MEVKNISKIYQGKKVVDTISFNIPNHAITSFIGPNGAGKSTILSMICKSLKKDSGEVWIEGKEIGDWKTEDLAKKVAFLHQTQNTMMRLRVEELVAFGRFPHSQGKLKEKDLEKIEEALEYMELIDIREKFIDELSGGQRQRAYIAMVIAQDTEYILLDEPLNNLDIKHSVQIMKILRRLVDELNKTVVIVIHDINFAAFYSDYILALKEGKEAVLDRVDAIMTSESMTKLYDVPCSIMDVNCKKMCMYYQ